MSDARFVVGIDLGTTNSAVAFVDTAAAAPAIEMFAIAQLVAPGAVEPRPTLPSFLYLPADAEFDAGAAAAAVGRSRRAAIVGEFARNHGWQVPTRLVSSAKSWLCHAGVDRAAPILPWQAPAEVPKVSPVEASARYLAHLARGVGPRASRRAARRAGRAPDRAGVVRRGRARADRARRGRRGPAARDAARGAAGRVLRVARATPATAGASELAVGDVVLVCDVGGGTTDFSLIAVGESRRQPGARARRRRRPHPARRRQHGSGAGAHACARASRPKGTSSTTGSSRRWRTRAAPPRRRCSPTGDRDTAPVAVLGRGCEGDRRLGAHRAPARRRRARARRRLLPRDARSATSRAAPRASACASSACRSPPTPRSRATCRRFLGAGTGDAADRGAVQRRRHEGARRCASASCETLDSWADSPEDDLKVLAGTDLDLAVAHGAAYYGLVRRGKGVRIRGGTARAYYIGIESSMPAVPGVAPPLQALCVAPFGMEEGTEAELPGAGVRPGRRRAGRVPLPGVVDAPRRSRRHRGRGRATRRSDGAGAGVDDARGRCRRTPASWCR